MPFATIRPNYAGQGAARQTQPQVVSHPPQHLNQSRAREKLPLSASSGRARQSGWDPGWGPAASSRIADVVPGSQKGDLPRPFAVNGPTAPWESSNTGGESRTGAGGLLLYINELGGDLAHGLACSGGHRSSGSAKYHGRVSPNAVSRQLGRFRQHSITALREYTLRRRLGPCRSSMGKSQAGWVARWRDRKSVV